MGRRASIPARIEHNPQLPDRPATRTRLWTAPRLRMEQPQPAKTLGNEVGQISVSLALYPGQFPQLWGHAHLRPAHPCRRQGCDHLRFVTAFFRSIDGREQ